MNRSNKYGNSKFEKTSVFFTVMMSFITLGFYVPYWFMTRQKQLNQLGTPTKLPTLPAKIVFGLYLFTTLLLVISTMDESIETLYNLIDPPITLVGSLIGIYLALQTRKLLNEYLGEKD
ncbi:DUF4234 domain-containing protein [Hazenella sp. IB182357]|uniref:DUF4234 domain-containing protein n=1 Tax=Polycladospora coralii TaxID=2771432 RepID=A0A926RYN0_9BACL|nr:DUF4234 domain-containing protein [Polycladospora coralii]MBD1373666.1 DUF4234 domain-containing protein [Polycladospora coralii]